MRRPIVAGNWKMHLGRVDEALAFVRRIRYQLNGIEGVDKVLCPPFTVLAAVAEVIRPTRIGLGAQTMHWEDQGAYTGEVSPAMLAGLCQYVILGHSERRTGRVAFPDQTAEAVVESDAAVNHKVHAALAHGLIPIICVGEKLEQREANKTEEVVEIQVEGAFKDLNDQEAEKTVVAYEPVWAIGTGRTATPQQANEVHLFVRKLLSSKFGKECSEKINVLYGGSVKPENSKELLEMPEIDGALVGGASLDAESFEKIVRSVIEF